MTEIKPATPSKPQDTQLELFSNAPFSIRLTLSEALRLLWDHDWQFLARASTTRKCWPRINSILSGRYVDEIGREDIERLRRELAAQGLSPASVNIHHGIMVRLFNKLYEWKEQRTAHGIDFTKISLPSRNPAQMVPRADERPFARKIAWPKKLVLRLIAAAQRLGDQDFAEKIQMLYATRLRPGDLWRMTSNNVDLARNTLSGIQHKTITRRLPSGVPYLLAIGPIERNILERRLAIRAEGEPLFPESNHQKRWKRIRTVANLNHVQLRDLRPSSATLLLDNNIDVETVADSLGHTTLRMLPRYARRTIIHQRKAQEVLADAKTEILM